MPHEHITTDLWLVEYDNPDGSMNMFRVTAADDAAFLRHAAWSLSKPRVRVWRVCITAEPIKGGPQIQTCLHTYTATPVYTITPEGPWS